MEQNVANRIMSLLAVSIFVMHVALIAVMIALLIACLKPPGLVRRAFLFPVLVTGFLSFGVFVFLYFWAARSSAVGFGGGAVFEVCGLLGIASSVLGLFVACSILLILSSVALPIARYRIVAQRETVTGRELVGASKAQVLRSRCFKRDAQALTSAWGKVDDEIGAFGGSHGRSLRED